ncbi:MAG TPA: universal stress protein [Sphingomicrobium sp.]
MRQQSATQLTMERPQPVPVAHAFNASGIKTILFHVHEDESLLGRLQFTLELARDCGAHVHFLHVTPIEAYTVVDAFGGTFVNCEIVEALEEASAQTREKIEHQLKGEDVTWDYEEITGELLPHLVGCAALSDLVITGREPHDRDFGGPAITRIGDLLAQMRRPLLVTGDELYEWDPLGPAVIAWNGSCEAANAVRGAVPLLKMASSVHVLEFTDEKKRRFPSTAVLEFLSRHGIHAELEVRPVPAGIEHGLVNYAQRLDARFIVMGGYSHSRAGEFLFGGVTRALLKDCPVALLIAR